MLPGFRFLFAAIVLSMSILVFGLGAAALLRAAHEEFANLPLRRTPPGPVFARQNDNPMPTLALLRVDQPVAEEPVDDVPAAAAPEIAPDILAPAAQALDDASPAEPETVATVSPEEPVQAEAVKPETPATETIMETPAAPAETAPAANAEVKFAAIAETPEPPAATAPPPPPPVADALALEGNTATRIATLGGPAVIVDEKASAKTTDAKPDRSAVTQLAAQRARERRLVVRRARLAREAALAQEQLLQLQNNPFAQIQITRAIR